MASDDNVIFIDSQLYIDLFRTDSGKDLLALLEEQRDHIFITEQIVNEVNRHKLSEAKLFFQRDCQIGNAPGCKLPNHLFDDSGVIVQRIRDILKVASGKVKEANNELEKAIAATLQRISLSEDVVSTALAPLFAKAVVYEAEEFERAKIRNARGIPPGKKVGAVGDELNWEQFISFVKRNGKRKLWIISRDSDYCLTYGKQSFLVPTLHEELKGLSDPPPEVRVFTNIPDGIKDFSEATGTRASKLPSPEKIEEIKKEQDSLPPLGWSPVYSNSPQASTSPSSVYLLLNSAPPGGGVLLGEDTQITLVNNPGTITLTSGTLGTGTRK
jgi:PIN domain